MNEHNGPEPDIERQGMLPMPTEVLYFFNEPLLFLIREGGGARLCLKTEETDAAEDELLVTPVTDDVVAAVRGSRLSLRGAMDQPGAETVTYDPVTRVISSRRPFVDKPGGRSPLPKPGVALQPGGQPMPDHL